MSKQDLLKLADKMSDDDSVTFNIWIDGQLVQLGIPDEDFEVDRGEVQIILE